MVRHKNTFLDFLGEQVVIMNFFNEFADVDHVSNVSFTSGGPIDCTKLLVFLCLSNDEFQQYIVIV